MAFAPQLTHKCTSVTKNIPNVPLKFTHKCTSVTQNIPS